MRFRDRSIASKLTRIVAGTTAMAILLAMLIFSAASIFKVYGDAQDKFSDQDAADLKKKGVDVLMWADNLSIEQRAMLDLPWAQV